MFCAAEETWKRKKFVLFIAIYLLLCKDGGRWLQRGVERVNVNLIRAAMLRTAKIYPFNTCCVGFLLIYYEILEMQKMKSLEI